MKTRMFIPIIAVLFAAFALQDVCFAQAARNTNLSRKHGSVIAGGWGNMISSNSTNSSIGGGLANMISYSLANDQSVIAGGRSNRIVGSGSSIGGGADNTVEANYSTIGGGYLNKASEGATTVGGGWSNTASGISATVGGGGYNTSSGRYATVAGGRDNTAGGDWSTIPGGQNAFATHDGSFVWGSETNIYTTSFASNSFTVRAAGGVRFITTTNSSFSGANTNNGVYLGPGENSWSALSDSNAKTAVEPVDSRQILRKLAALPVARWQYKGQPDRSYIGPMAQDFHAAFGLGRDDKRISTADSDGVMYAAIQGLVEELKERDKAMAARDRTIEELKAKNSELSRSIEAINDRFNSLPPAH